MRWLRRGILGVFLAWLLVASGGGYRPTNLDLLLAPHLYSLLTWELEHLPEKWFHQVDHAVGRWLRLYPAPSHQDREAWAQEYFSLARRAGEVERSLQGQGPPSDPPDALSGEQVRQALQELAEIRRRRVRLRPLVEETIEGAISDALAQAGLDWRAGVVLPPVDAVLSSSPGILVASPRDRIQREWAVLLEPDLDDRAKELVEAGVLEDRGLSAIVEGTGGVASYPSVVADIYGLHYGMVTVAHEWVHQWLFFHPLGQGFDRTPELTTINETVATLVGEEIGDRAFTALTGEVVDRPEAPANPPVPKENAAGFDFNAAMRETRLRTEDLLAQGKIDEAEAYMEQRRRLLAAEGYYIRKLNQAYFAFHGSYATSGGSVSPIGQQLQELRRDSASVAEFLHLVAGFGSYQEFLDTVEAERPSG